MIGPNFPLLWIIVGTLAAICILILGLLSWAMLLRNARAQAARCTAARQDSREVFWIIAPLLVFAVVSVPLLRLSYLRNAIPPADLTIRLTARMWYWTYEYSGRRNFSFVAPMLSKAPTKGVPADPPSTAYDHIVVPVAKTVRIVAVCTNVIYSWAIPSIGAKVESLPGQINQSWFVATKEGRYYGQCSELCGLPHEFRPIEIEVVSQKHFDSWAAVARQRFASAALAPRAQPQPR